ncbi:hypothetical protein PRK78_006742 [Emydomyces testavorans]|uniref:Uncharacterized protein n=1 Tax=Emydomyces testavorans TaxID=2070801 RepID=A0AAF0DP04_9EURO|nr:hypothetical protein PRK78_006742 [Emydomyces testavorans]
MGGHYEGNRGAGTLRPGDARHPPYTPVSLVQELCIMFGFIGFSIITMAVYWFFWQAVQRRNAAKEADRLEAIAARTRARAAAEKQHVRDLNGSRDDSLEWRNKSNASTGGSLCDGSRRLARNGTSANGLGFGDLEEDLVV